MVLFYIFLTLWRMPKSNLSIYLTYIYFYFFKRAKWNAEITYPEYKRYLLNTHKYLNILHALLKVPTLETSDVLFF